MRLVIPLSEATAAGPHLVGGKACALCRMQADGMPIPRGICVSTDAYRLYMTDTGLNERIVMHLFRKCFEEMRWEEIWDVALRVRNLFLATPLPETLYNTLADAVDREFLATPVVVRSSAPEEDAASSSFAGLHDSFVNVSGVADIISSVRLVWASLWSDRALLYRQELGLDIQRSAMAVVIQELVFGDRSGIAFSQHPQKEVQGVVEAVYGLNQGLVDGAIEPDRWFIDRASSSIIQHCGVKRVQKLVPTATGVCATHLESAQSAIPPLTDEEALTVFQAARNLESLFGAPQDIEWTLRANQPFFLQARPITCLQDKNNEDVRRWYLSLRRSLDNLKGLHSRIEGVHLPEMDAEAASWAATNLDVMSDEELALEIENRQQRLAYWAKVYKDDFIPFAHGMRLFGQFYNDAVQPEDPYEFMDMLTGADLLSKRRNRQMDRLAGLLRQDARLAEAVAAGEERVLSKGAFGSALDELLEAFGDTTWGHVRLAHDRMALARLLLEMSQKNARHAFTIQTDSAGKEAAFLNMFTGEHRDMALALLEIGRASYRLRDNDNIYIGKIRGQLIAALAEACCRISRRGVCVTPNPETASEFIKALRDSHYTPVVSPAMTDLPDTSVPLAGKIKPRQIVGQPAGAGIGIGAARVVNTPEALFEFRTGEVLVCDSVDPNMTFIVPLAAGIVERRGGMLIHGAIIAREYGIPCVTGVPDATRLIQTGEKIAVDGHLGIVVIG